ncbi:MAG TPA: heme-copper oxidase subunit III [Polyangia bacterium]|jgi:cytochrome c oxidase subunit 3|nr:heme-copper oxidase subunit III [Polyangia bacterium]
MRSLAPAEVEGVVVDDRGAAAREIDSLVGMAIFLAAWAMLFAALFLAYGVVRVQAAEWPPFGAPRLPRAAPALNTLLLVAAGLTLRRGLARARRRHDARVPRPALLASILLGLAFLGAQIALGQVMRARGLLPSSGVYGSVFFALTGFHALHVLGGLCALAWLALRDRRGPRPGPGAEPLRAARLVALYWDFMAVVWLLMYLAIFWL